MDAWKSERAKEVFLSLADAPKTQNQLIKETGYNQGHISKILRELSHAALVFKASEIKKGRLPETVWDINTDQFIQRILYFKDPHFSRGSSLRGFKVIPQVIRNYLKIVSGSVLIRNQKWLENNAEDLYPEEAKKGKEKLLWDWKNSKEHTRFEKITLEDLGEMFIEYLLVNRETPKLRSKQGQEETLQLMERYHLSNDSRYLRDVELEEVKPRLIIADKKAKK
jgi:hypothetical protein